MKRIQKSEKLPNGKFLFTEEIYRSGKKIIVKAQASSYTVFLRYIQLKYGPLK